MRNIFLDREQLSTYIENLTEVESYISCFDTTLEELYNVVHKTLIPIQEFADFLNFLYKHRRGCYLNKKDLLHLARQGFYRGCYPAYNRLAKYGLHNGGLDCLTFLETSDLARLTKKDRDWLNKIDVTKYPRETLNAVPLIKHLLKFRRYGIDPETLLYLPGDSLVDREYFLAVIHHRNLESRLSQLVKRISSYHGNLSDIMLGIFMLVYPDIPKDKLERLPRDFKLFGLLSIIEEYYLTNQLGEEQWKLIEVLSESESYFDFTVLPLVSNPYELLTYVDLNLDNNTLDYLLNTMIDKKHCYETYLNLPTITNDNNLAIKLAELTVESNLDEESRQLSIENTAVRVFTRYR